MVLKVRFLDSLTVYHQEAAFKSNGFTGQPYDAFHEHHARSGHANSHNIAALWRGMAIREAVHEINSAIVIGGEHAVSLDADREDDEFENEKFEETETKNCEHSRADERAFWVPPHERNTQPGRESGSGGSGFHVIHFNTASLDKFLLTDRIIKHRVSTR